MINDTLPMTAPVAPARPHFSLDQAASILRHLEIGTWADCPECGRPLEAHLRGAGPRAVWLLRCRSCERGVMVENSIV